MPPRSVGQLDDQLGRDVLATFFVLVVIKVEVVPIQPQ